MRQGRFIPGALVTEDRLDLGDPTGLQFIHASVCRLHHHALLILVQTCTASISVDAVELALYVVAQHRNLSVMLHSRF